VAVDQVIVVPLELVQFKAATIAEFPAVVVKVVVGVEVLATSTAFLAPIDATPVNRKTM